MIRTSRVRPDLAAWLGAFLFLVLLIGCASTAPRSTVETIPANADTPELNLDTLAAVAAAPLSPESVLLAEADLYYRMAVEASADRRFDDAEYNFEKALELLAGLDPETEFTEDESQHIASLLQQIGEDYQATIRARGDEVSAPEMSAFMMRFEDLESLRHWRGYAEMQRSIKPDSVEYNIPVVWNDRVKNCIIYFQTLARSNMELYLTRAGKYLPLMKDIFTAYGLPTDLCYLPIVESGFNTSAYSYARAMGPWQFIASTGRNYGLDRTWWVDERRDFEHSTHGAAKYLKFLYERFDDWYLALAAYNGGEGRVDRTIRRQKTRDFWEMRLRKQTENYVPLYLAALIIAKDPERFGFYVEPEPPLEFDKAEVDKPIELKVVARRLGCEEDLLKELNPELLRGVTPPRVSSYTLRVPKGMGDTFQEMYASIPQSERTEWVRHTIRRGEALSTIARKYGVSVQAIKDANKMRGTRIIAGRSLTIPVPIGARVSSGHRVVASAGGQYRVRPGDTMWDIARAHGTSVSELARMNNISSRRRIYPGQMLRVPEIAGSRHSGTFTYVVRRGDNLTRIARRFGIGVADILALNKLSNPEVISIGTRLTIPGTE